MYIVGVGSRAHFLTVAADLVAEGIIEPLRFTRSVNTLMVYCICCDIYTCRVLKVKVGKHDALGSLISTFSRRKAPTETFALTLEKVHQ